MNELFEQKTPHSSEAEQAVLGAILIEPNCVVEVVQKLRSDDFFLEINRDIYDTIFNMFAFSKVIDPITVIDEMRVRGVGRENSHSYIMELMQVTPTAANVMRYVDVLRELSLMRALAIVGRDISEMVLEGAASADQMLEAAERKIYALRQGRTVGGLVSIASIVHDVYEQIGKNSENGATIPGLSTGLGELDATILGLNKGNLVLIASRPGMGKTSIAMNIALHVAKNYDKSVAIFSLEMAREQLAMRLLSAESLIDNKKLLTGELNDRGWQELANAASVLSRTKILIDDNSTLSVSDMNSQCRRIDDLGLVVIDYLQLMQSAGGTKSYANENRQQVVSDMSRMLKIMAKELNVPVICLSQLSRANVQRADKRPQLSDLRESGAIEQDADVVIGLYRDSYFPGDEESENPNAAEAIVLKNRHGETRTVDLIWQAEYTRYVSVDRRHDEY